jgi:hypothetical protein
MITCNLCGGLGNQLFQIAVAFNHAKNNSDESGFNFNNSHTPNQGNNSSKYKDTIFKYFNHVDNVYDICYNTFTQKGHSHCQIPYEKDQQLQGYFQSEKFFLENKDEIINMLRKGIQEEYPDLWSNVNDKLNNLKKNGIPIVSVHIRRGDYIKFQGVHDLCPIEYYQNGLRLMEEKIGRSFNSYIISDDVKWCKMMFPEKGYFSNNDEIEDLITMINCDHNIIANSSFSWWGAYLNVNENIVISPNKWFGVNGPKDQQDIIPNNWIKI